MGFFAKAKEAIDGAQSNMMGETWIAEVKDEQGWKKLEGWRDQYEPKKPKKEASTAEPKEESQFSKTAKQKAIEHGLNSLQDNLCYEVMNVMLESACKVLGTSHNVTAKDTSNPLHKSIVPFLAALNTVLLSFRFDKTGTGATNKFRFIRREACGDIANIAHEYYASGKSSDQLVQEFNAVFGEDQKSNMRAVLIDEMDKMIKEKADTLDKDDEKMAKLKEFLGEGQDNMILQFLSFVAVSKMDVVRAHLLVIIEHFFKNLDDEMSGEKKSKEELQEGILVFTEEKYKEARDKLNAEAGYYMAMIKGMIINGGPSQSVEEANA